MKPDDDDSGKDSGNDWDDGAATDQGNSGSDSGDHSNDGTGVDTDD